MTAISAVKHSPVWTLIPRVWPGLFLFLEPSADTMLILNTSDVKP